MTAKDLKNALLQEAVQGKLVPQIATEGNARDLLEEIRKEKAKLVKEGIIKKEKPLPEITEEEIPFDIPESWCWCRLSELGLYRKGPFGSSLTKAMFVPKSNDSIKVYEQKNAIQKDYSLGEYYISKNKFETMQSFIIEPSDIIVSCAGTIGEVYKLPKEAPIGIINQALMRVKLFNDSLSAFWMMYFDYVLKKEASKQGAGTAIKNIPPFEILKAYPFPLPPLAEQKRIVATIEKFMPLIEEYGKKETELKAFNEQIGTLTKKAILQEAVQGKLVPQIAAEGNAKDLLEEIRKERLSHGLDFANAKSGKRKSRKETALAGSNPCDIKENEIPFDIPENWCWCRITDISTCELGKTKDALKNKGEMKDYLCSINIQEDGIDLSKVKQMKFEEGEYERYTVKKNDLLICEGGDAGRCAIYDKDEPMYYQNALHRVRFFYNLNPKFYLYVFQVYKANKILTEASKGVTIQHLTGTALKELNFPLPPLAEQKRIVAAIEKILPLCARLSSGQEKLGE